MILIWYLLIATTVKLTASQCEKYTGPNVVVLNNTHPKGVQTLANGFLHAIGTRVDSTDYYEIISDTVSGHVKKALLEIWPTVKKRPGFTACFIAGILMAVVMPLVGVIVMAQRYSRCSTGEKRKSQRIKLARQDAKLSCRLAAGLLLCWTFWLACVGFYYQNSAEVWPHLSLVRDGILDQIADTTKYLKSVQEESKCLSEAAMTIISGDIAQLMKKLPDEIMGRIVPLLPTEMVDNLYETLHKSLVIQEEYHKKLLKLNQSDLPTIKEYHKFFVELGFIAAKDDTRTIVGTSDCRLMDVTASNLQNYINEAEPPIRSAIDQMKDALISKKNVTAEVEKRIRDKMAERQTYVQDKVENVRKKLKEVITTVERQSSKLIGSLENAKSTLREVASPARMRHYNWVKHAINLLILPALLIVIGVLAASGCGAWGYRRSSSAKIATAKGFRDFPRGASVCFQVTAFLGLLFGAIIVTVTFLLFFVGYASEAVVCEPLFRSRDLTYLDQVTRAVRNLTNSQQIGFNLSHLLSKCQQNSGVVNALNIVLPTYAAPDVEIDFEYSSLTKGMNDYARTLRKTAQSTKRARDLVSFGHILKTLADPEPHPGLLLSCEKETAGVIENDKQDRSHWRKKHSKMRKEYPEIASRLDNLSKMSYMIQTEVNNLNRKANGLAKKLADFNTASTEANFHDVVHDVKTTISSTINSTREKALQIFMNLGRCRALYDIYRNAGELFCGEIVDPVNGMWFSMGMQLLALVPTVVFSLLLSTHFLVLSAHRSEMLEIELL